MTDPTQPPPVSLVERLRTQKSAGFTLADSFALSALLTEAAAEISRLEGEADEMALIGERDGYERAVQDIDLLTGGDGEYRFCTDGDPERHTPDAAAMKVRIVARFSAAEASLEQAVGVLEEVAAVFEKFDLAKLCAEEPYLHAIVRHAQDNVLAALSPSIGLGEGEKASSAAEQVARARSTLPLEQAQRSAGREVDLAELQDRILATNPLLPNDMARLNGYIDALVDNENEAWPPNYTGRVDTLQALARRLGLDERAISAAALDVGQVDSRPLSLLYAAVMVRRLIERDGQTFTPLADAQWSRLALSSGSPPVSPSEASAATSVGDHLPTTPSPSPDAEGN